MAFEKRQEIWPVSEASFGCKDNTAYTGLDRTKQVFAAVEANPGNGLHSVLGSMGAKWWHISSRKKCSPVATNGSGSRAEKRRQTQVPQCSPGVLGAQAAHVLLLFSFRWRTVVHVICPAHAEMFLGIWVTCASGDFQGRRLYAIFQAGRAVAPNYSLRGGIKMGIYPQPAFIWYFPGIQAVSSMLVASQGAPNNQWPYTFDE